MTSRRASRLRLRLLSLPLAIPLVVVPAVSYIVLPEGGEGSTLPVLGETLAEQVLAAPA